MGQTITEKILSRVIGRKVSVGDIVHPVPELMTVHDWYVANFDKALQEFGVMKLFDPGRVLISTDHEPLAVTPQSSERQKRVREIVEKYGIKQFYDVGRGGLGHIFPIEEGIVRPGMAWMSTARFVAPDFLLTRPVHFTRRTPSAVKRAISQSSSTARNIRRANSWQTSAAGQPS